MKKFKTLAALAMTAIMSISMATMAFGDANFDEYGNIIENQPVDEDGLIVTTAEEIDLEDWGFEMPMPGSVFNTVKGQVVEFLPMVLAEESDFIVVEGEYGYIHLRTDFNTFFPNGKPQAGDRITAFHDAYAMIPMIYPPQYLAFAIVVEDEAEVGFNFLGRFDENKVSFDNQRRLTIDEDTEIIFQGGDVFEGNFEEDILAVGRKLFVEYTRSGRDIYPTTIFPTRIVILYERIAFGPEFIGDIGFDIDLYEYDWEYGYYYSILLPPSEITPIEEPPIEEAGHVYDVTINGVGLPGVKAVTVGDSIWPNYLPLRPIIEHLDENILWDGANRAVIVTSPRGTITFRVGLPYFAVLSADEVLTTYTLNDAPIIQNNVTLVPISFFREVFGFNNAYFASGVTVINNDEVMQ